MALCKVCTVIGLRLEDVKKREYSKTILLKKGMTKPNKERLNKVIELDDEEHH